MNNRTDWTKHPVEVYITLSFLFCVMLMIIINQYGTIKDQQQQLDQRYLKPHYYPDLFDCDDDTACADEDLENSLLEDPYGN